MASKKSKVSKMNKKTHKSTAVKKVAKALKKKVLKTKTKAKAQNKTTLKAKSKAKAKTKTKTIKTPKKSAITLKVAKAKNNKKIDVKKTLKKFTNKKASKAFISDLGDEDEDYLNEELTGEENEGDDLDSVAFDDDAKFEEDDDNFEKEEKNENTGSLDEVDEEELRDQSEGSYSFGWGYNDAFDRPDEVVEKKEFDEDEQYARGLSSDDDEDFE